MGKNENEKNNSIWNWDTSFAAEKVDKRIDGKCIGGNSSFLSPTNKSCWALAYVEKYEMQKHFEERMQLLKIDFGASYPILCNLLFLFPNGVIEQFFAAICKMLFLFPEWWIWSFFLLQFAICFFSPNGDK